MKRADRIERWLEALESGKYKQTKSVLQKINGDKSSYCCLGVACVLEGIDIDFETDGKRLNYTMTRLLGIDSYGYFKNIIKHRNKPYESLADLNDNGVRFKTIARIIREQLKAGNFRKPRF